MGYRPQRIASVVRRVVGEAISLRLSDPRIHSMTSVTRVRVSRDLQYADVYVSVMGAESDARTTLRGLQAAHGRLQSMVAKALPIRQVPVLRFHLDESIKRGFETLRLIEQSMAEIRQREAERAAASQDASAQTPAVDADDRPQESQG